MSETFRKLIAKIEHNPVSHIMDTTMRNYIF